MLAGFSLFLSLTTPAEAQERYERWPEDSGRYAGRYSSREDRHLSEDLLAELGERLFFDTRLSGSGRTACATCHEPGYAFAEPRRVSIFDGGRPGPRNAPSLLTASFFPELMWDGRFPSLERQAFGPFARNGEMGSTIEDAAGRIAGLPEYEDLFEEAFGGEATPERMVRALAAYQRTLRTGTSRFDHWLDSGDDSLLSPLEREGYAIFNTKGRCGICHLTGDTGREREGRRRLPLFTDFRFHNIGAGRRSGPEKDPGRYRVTGNPRDRGAFRTPSLRNVARTAPYMHDGSLPSLEAVVEFYNAGGGQDRNVSPLIEPLSLSRRERAALVAFLETLNDEDGEAQGEPGYVRLRTERRD